MIAALILILCGIILGLQPYFGERKVSKIKDKTIKSLKKDLEFWQELYDTTIKK